MCAASQTMALCSWNAAADARTGFILGASMLLTSMPSQPRLSTSAATASQPGDTAAAAVPTSVLIPAGPQVRLHRKGGHRGPPGPVRGKGSKTAPIATLLSRGRTSDTHMEGDGAEIPLTYEEVNDYVSSLTDAEVEKVPAVAESKSS